MTLVDGVLAAIRDADAAFADAVAADLVAVRAALDTYAVAEARNLGDFVAGRYLSDVAAAWDALVAARDQLETSRAAAETARQAAYAAALGGAAP